MANSTQTVTSTGTLVLLDLSFNYIDRSEITVFFNNVLTTAWAWVGATSKQISFTPAVPNGTIVLIKRTTNANTARHIYVAGAAFTSKSLDESLQQVLHITQESQEASISKDFFNDLNLNSYKITNVGTAVSNTDVPNLGQVNAVTASSVSAAAASATASASSATASAASATAAAASAASINDSNIVHKTLAETIGGVKTFTSSPVMPGNATTALQAVPKQQLDAAIAAVPAGVTSVNTRSGAVTIVSTDVTSALGFTPAINTHNHDASYSAIGHAHAGVYVAVDNGHGNIGSFCFATGGKATAGTTYAGSQLQSSGISNNEVSAPVIMHLGPALTGTWRAVSSSDPVGTSTSYTALFQRIA